MQSGKCGENLTWTLDNDYYGTLIISGTGAMENYSYPNAPWHFKSIEKVIVKDGVTTIGDSAFCHCNYLMSVIIPDSVTSIGYAAFDFCESLREVIIPDSVTFIDNSAFSACRSLTSVKISANITTIGNSVFDNCKNLTSITIPDNVTMIGEQAFSFCENLKSITIPDSVTIIGDMAFWHCESLVSVVIPDSVTTIGYRAFSGCKSLTSVKIPDSITKISYEVFYKCDSLSKLHYPAGSGFEYELQKGNNAQLIPYTNKPPVTKSKPQPVKKSKAPPAQIKLTSQPVSKPITQPVTEKLRWKVAGKTLTVGGVREIESYSYSATPWGDSLRDIQKIIIEDGVEKISARAFENCTRLEQVIISASVKSIGDFAFTICYCGNRKINSGTNVIWSLEDGVLMIKKNPAAKSDADFSTGYETWEVVEKNITGVKIERGIVPGKRFFDWLAHMGNSVQVSF